MAQLPCTACQKRHPFLRNSGVYCHLWNNGLQHDYRLRLCPSHIGALQHDLAKYESVVTNDAAGAVDPPTECFACRKPVDETGWYFAATAYPAKDERKDYWARLHVDCTMPEWGLHGQPLNS